MEKISYEYSIKNIPILSKTSCNSKLIKKIESVIKRMRWKANFFLNGGKCRQKAKKLELKKFEKDLFDIVSSMKFSNYKNDFQQKLDADIAELKESINVFVLANNNSNIYKM